MRRNFVISSFSTALLLACSGLAHAGQGVEVQGMAVVDSNDRTRAVIDVPEGTSYEVFALANPNRLVLDLHNSRFSDDFRIPGPDGVVANVRTGEPAPGDVRVVFDLAAKVKPKSYFQNEAGHPQLVIELQTAPGSKFHLTATASAVPAPTQSVPMRSAQVPEASSSQPGMFQNVPAQSASSRPDARPSGPPVSAAFALPAAATPSVAPLGGAQAAAAVSPGSESSDGMIQPQVAMTAIAARQPTSAELRRDNPRVDPPVSTVVMTQQPAQDAQAAAYSSQEPAPINHPGARTVRDVLGAGQRKIVIAIDPGHGGKDTGACGYSGTYEKNVTLATARELAREINAEPGMQAVLTRDSDVFVPLAERYYKAREAKADLFISIHADADPTHTATGSSVWVLSERGVTSQAARWLADRENAADLIGGVSLSDKDGTLASVLLDLSQSATMKASEDAAERVHQALRDIGRTHKEHPERANFVVLRSPDVPSMLVETAFITNAEEERHLNDPEYRARLAGAVLSGVRSYFIDNPLPGTEFAALHDRGSRGTRATAAVSSSPRMIATAMHPSDAAQMEPASARSANIPVQLATADDSQQYHVVQRGERLIDIANEYGVSMMRLREVNDLQGNQVHEGQQLRIPSRSNAG